ncbi:MAG: WD40 repeat domain-containing serine/threonine protein kinase [Hyphomicrobiaceae bacterium]
MTNLLALPQETELVGDYRLRRVLGAGGFGITYLADEIALARNVTIKEYFPADFAARKGPVQATPRSHDCAGDYKWGLDRFIEEAQTLARFDHPNIVRVYRYFRANNTGYMVLHFEEGASFKQWLKGLKRAPRQAELDPIVSALLDALEVIHKGDFLHRDIAPDNIIIRKDGSPVLIDFGSARGEIASHSKTVSALVKPGYSPYEQYASTSSAQGPWTDIYALAATLYHAVTGKRPADAPSRMVNDDLVPAVDAALSSYRKPFLTAIDAALKLEISERPQSIAAWRGMLLAPEQKAERGRAKRKAVAPANDDAPEVKSTPGSKVPPPPDAPQPKGQLLAFIDGLKRSSGAPAPDAPKKAKARSEPEAEVDVVAVAAPAARVAAGGRFGLGYGPAPAAAANAATVPIARAPAPTPSPLPAAKEVRDRPASKPKSALAPVERRTPSSRRGFRYWFGATRRWRPVVYKLIVGLGIASLAVAYQDRLPHFELRGFNLPHSQTGDLAGVSRFAGHNGAVTLAALDDEGRTLVSAGADATLRLWNVSSGALGRTLELDNGAATALAVRERKALSGHADGTIALWDTDRGEKLSIFKSGEAAITGLAFLNEGRRFIATGRDGRIALWDVATPSAPLRATFGHEGSIEALAALPQRDLIATGGSDMTVKLWFADGLTLRRTYRGHRAPVTALAIAPGGRALASGSADGNLRLWSLASTRLTASARAHQGAIAAIAFAPRDRIVATAGRDGAVKVWDTRERAIASFKGHPGGARAVVFTADGRRVASTGEDGLIRLWTVSPGQQQARN